MNQIDPFNQFNGNFSDHCRNFLYSLDLDESRIITRDEKSIATTRMTLKYVSNELNAVIKTRLDVDGNLWVKRIS